MEKSLVALDTDHIKKYVFATDKLKEIRGASSILDRLNRQEMRNIAANFQAWPIYTNGGAGLFVVDADRAQQFMLNIQKTYSKNSQGKASFTGVIQELPKGTPEDRDALMTYSLKYELDLLRLRLRTKKDSPPDIISLPSHPFMQHCYSCGIEYAEDVDRTGASDPDELDAVYCASCLRKRKEDKDVRDSMKEYTEKRVTAISASPLWNKVLRRLREIDYDIPVGTKRPEDFNYFHNFAKTKDYLGLIYADGNSMGTEVEKLTNLQEVHDFAHLIDDSIYEAVCDAIKMHLHVWVGRTQENNIIERLFPFDLLLLGGDDVVMVTSAAAAMDVALTITKRFHELTKAKDPKRKGYTLSVGVILAPIKYPFGLLQDLAETTLKAAKKRQGKQEKQEEKKGQKELPDYRDTSINFMVVAGSTSHDFDKVYRQMQNKDGQVSGYDSNVNFYATLRPYTVEELEILLKAIRDGRNMSLGRTKLHQVREAVLKMNLTTSVGESLAVLRNWRQSQREFVYSPVYRLGDRYQERHQDIEKPGTLFPRVTFPWFADGDNVYRTSLLDFVELYDFVASEEDSGAEDRPNRN